VRLLEILLKAGRTVHLVISPAATEVIEQELGVRIDLKRLDTANLLRRGVDVASLHYHHYQDFRAGIASGSFLTAGMVVCPCSMGTIAAIAHGTSANLIHRAADVHLKERRKLVLVPRETPLGIVQLRNLTAVAEAGAIVLPASPAFYTLPKSVNDMIDFIVGRVCDQLGVEHGLLKRWGEDSP
jgi:4-hydroxy-3-polyprenylbenzoate decarboxylase